jgi:hypothetical protein
MGIWMCSPHQVWDNKIAWYENDGQQTFTSHTITTAADGAASVYAADVDGDGDMDVLSASWMMTKSPGMKTTASRISPAIASPPLQMGPHPSMPPMWTGTGIWMCSRPHIV